MKTNRIIGGPRSVVAADRKRTRRSAPLHLLLCVAAFFASLAGAAPVRVLILTGDNNHNWQATTPVLQQILTASGQFAVDVTEHPDQCTAASLAPYDVLLSNWNNLPHPNMKWSDAIRAAFLDFVRNGKGIVFVHAGSSSFYDWPEYHLLAGATWKNNVTHHNAPHTFTVKPTATKHAITHGLKPFTHTDELWLKPGVQPDAVVLATGDNQPVALVTAFGKGRGFTTLMGHDAKFMATPGFQTLLVRGTEWAATGKVAEPSVSDYRYGQSRTVLAGLETLSAAKLAALLSSDATTDCKKAVCERLSLVGTDTEVPVLAKLISDKELGFYARFALERIPGEKSLAALRAALPNPGAIAALGARRNGKAVPALAKLLPNEAAANALAEIGNREALAALATGPATALLRCALNLRDVKTLEKLCAAEYPRQVRTAAFIGRANIEGNAVVMAALTGKDETLQAAALTALQNSTDAALIGKVVAKMDSLPPPLQEQLLVLVGAHGDASALPSVTQMTASKEAGVRQAAVKALGAIGNASSVPVLEGFLESDDRKLAIESLTRLRGDGVDNAIVTTLGNPPQPELIKVLVARNATSAVPALLKLAAQNADAATAVGKLAKTEDGPAVIALLDSATDATRPAIEISLLAIYRRANTVEPVVDAAGKASGAQKASLINVLGQLGGAQALPALRAALKDSNLEVQTAAARALSNWPDAAPFEDLKAVAATTTDEKVKALALRGVERMASLASVAGKNLALGATATNPDGLKPDGEGSGPQAAIDGNLKTYWDETDNQKLYQIRVQLKQPATVRAIRITGFVQHEYAPKDFEIVCDDKPVKTVTGAQYTENVLTVALPATKCTTIQLNITGYYAGSPAIRELEIFGEEK